MNKKQTIVLVVFLAVVLAAGAGVFWVTRKDDDSAQKASSSPVTPIYEKPLAKQDAPPKDDPVKHLYPSACFVVGDDIASKYVGGNAEKSDKPTQFAGSKGQSSCEYTNGDKKLKVTVSYYNTENGVAADRKAANDAGVASDLSEKAIEKGTPSNGTKGSTKLIERRLIVVSVENKNVVDKDASKTALEQIVGKR